MGLILKIAAGVVLGILAIGLLLDRVADETTDDLIGVYGTDDSSLRGGPLLWNTSKASVVLSDSEWMAEQRGAYESYPECYGASTAETGPLGQPVYDRFRCVLTERGGIDPIARVWIQVTGDSSFDVYDLKTPTVD